MLAAVGMFLALWLGNHIAGKDTGLLLTLTLLAGGVLLYLCLLWMLGELDKETLVSLREAVLRHH
jgi:hypothetical protein